MGGGCSTKRSISVNDAGAKVNLKKAQEESKDESEQNVSAFQTGSKSKWKMGLDKWVEVGEMKLKGILMEDIGLDEEKWTLEEVYGVLEGF